MATPECHPRLLLEVRKPRLLRDLGGGRARTPAASSHPRWRAACHWAACRRGVGHRCASISPYRPQHSRPEGGKKTVGHSRPVSQALPHQTCTHPGHLLAAGPALPVAVGPGRKLQRQRLGASAARGYNGRAVEAWGHPGHRPSRRTQASAGLVIHKQKPCRLYPCHFPTSGPLMMWGITYI